MLCLVSNGKCICLIHVWYKMDHVGLKGHAKAVLEYVCTVYGHSIARVTSANR